MSDIGLRRDPVTTIPLCLHPHVTRFQTEGGEVRLWACDDCKRRFYPACPECVTIGHRDEETAHEPD